MNTKKRTLACLLTAAMLLTNGTFPVTAAGRAVGDVNGDNCVNALDAALILNEVATIGIGKESTFNEEQQKAADLNGDGIIKANDASDILYAAIRNGVDPAAEVPHFDKLNSIIKTTMEQGSVKIVNPKFTAADLEKWGYKVPVLIDVQTYAPVNSIEFGLTSNLPYQIISAQDIEKYANEPWYASLNDETQSTGFDKRSFCYETKNENTWFAYASNKADEISGVIAVALVDLKTTADFDHFVDFVGKTETRTAFVTEVSGKEMVVADLTGYGASVREMPASYAAMDITAKPDKLVYQIGEELDLTGGEASASGCMDGANWDIFHEKLNSKWFTVDASEFDNTKPGTYTIRVTCTTDTRAKDSFEVIVLEEPETTIPPTTDPSEYAAYEDFFIHSQKKKFYKPGDDLDLTGAYGALKNGDKIPLNDPRFTVDASEFSSTPGVYNIYVTFKDGSFKRTDSFMVMVLNSDGTAPDGYPAPTGEDNPFNPTSVESTAPVKEQLMTTVPVTTAAEQRETASEAPKAAVVSGDIDGNGETDIMDVIKINKCLLGTVELTGSARLAADINGDGKIDSADAIAILKKSLDMVWQDTVEPTTAPATEAPTDATAEPTTELADPTGNGKTEPSTEHDDPTTEPPTGHQPPTQPVQISEHFYGADISTGPASDGISPPSINVITDANNSLIGLYNSEFYENHRLITISLTETSGSNELSVDDVIVDEDGNYVVKITRGIPYIQTCDLKRWYFYVKTDKGCNDPAKVKLDITEKNI